MRALRHLLMSAKTRTERSHHLRNRSYGQPPSRSSPMRVLLQVSISSELFRSVKVILQNVGSLKVSVMITNKAENTSFPMSHRWILLKTPPKATMTTYNIKWRPEIPENQAFTSLGFLRILIDRAHLLMMTAEVLQVDRVCL